MPSLSKQQVRIIATAVRNQSPQVKATSAWLMLAQEYGLGEVRGSHIVFSRQDYNIWREILVADCGYDPSQTTLAGNRTEIAAVTTNEKWSSESELVKRASVTALGGELVTRTGRCGIIPQVEYRVDISTLNPDDYDALLVLENYEAFLFVHQFQLPDPGHVLAIYRGHDMSARAVMTLLSRAGKTPVIGFTDPDPAGLAIVNDTRFFTHVVIPAIDSLTGAPSLADRFKNQLAARPHLKAQCSQRSDAFQRYANWILDTGFASSQEWLCSHSVPLRLITLD